MMPKTLFLLPLLLPLVVFACSSDDSATPSTAPDAGGGGGDSSTTSDAGGGTDASFDAGNDVNNDAGNDADAAVTPIIGPGPYGIVYAGTYVGIADRAVADGTATFFGSTLTGYASEGYADEKPVIGTNTVKDAAMTSLYTIGRWSGGTTDGTYFDLDNAGKMTFAENGGFHYAIGRVADPIPSTGMTTYTIDKKTAATVSDGSLAPGTITGSLVVDLAGAASKIALSVTIDIAGSGTYTQETTGGIADPSQSDMVVLGSSSIYSKGAFFLNRTGVSNNGTACNNGTCAFSVYGIVVGQNAENVLVAVHFYPGGGGAPKSVSGVLAFKK